MYAHQVIEDLNNTRVNPVLNFAQYFQDEIDIAKNEIMNSVQFNIGKADDYIKLLRKHGRYINLEKEYKIPYSIIWIECCDEEKKTGILVVTDEVLKNGIEVGSIKLNYFMTSNGRWRMFPFHVRLFKGSDGYDIKFYDKKLKDRYEAITAIDYYGDLEDEKEEIASFIKKYILWGLATFHIFITLLNCKNIQIERIKASKTLNKKRIRNNKLPIFDYHILNVVVPSNKKTIVNKSVSLNHNRVHLCRGHFKEYTAEHSLFGKLTGLYWWQPYVRGQNRDGIVMKDYKITNRQVAAVEH